MLKIETKLYINNKRIISHFEELSLDTFKKKVWKDVEIHGMALRCAHQLRLRVQDVINAIEDINEKSNKKITPVEVSQETEPIMADTDKSD